MSGTPWIRDDDAGFMRLAFEQVLKSYNEGGLPIGAVMVENGRCKFLVARFIRERPDMWGRGLRRQNRCLSSRMRRVTELVNALETYTFMDRAPIHEVDVRRALDGTLAIVRPELPPAVTVERDHAPDTPSSG